MGNSFSVYNPMGHGGRFGERWADQTMEEHSKLARTGGVQACPREKEGTICQHIRHFKVLPPSILFILGETQVFEDSI